MYTDIHNIYTKKWGSELSRDAYIFISINTHIHNIFIYINKHIIYIYTPGGGVVSNKSHDLWHVAESRGQVRDEFHRQNVRQYQGHNGSRTFGR